MKKVSMLTAATLMAFAAFSASAAPVTQEGTGIGKHGDVTVAVTFNAGKIQSIKVVKEQENPVLSKEVFTTLKDRIIETNSADVDIISGATFSSKGLLDAVKDAAKKAGVTLSKADKKGR